MSTGSPLRTTASICCYCDVSCGILIEHGGERILGVRDDPRHPANFGRLCSRGASLHLTGDLQAHALYPQLRLGRRMARARSDQESALERAAERFAKAIREHGPDSVVFYISSQLLTKDYYAFNKLARTLIGTNNIDSNSRLCMSSMMIGYKRNLSADASSCSYEDLGYAGCILIAGGNMASAHPVLFHRLEATKAARPEVCIVVIDPRHTDICELADLHLALLPGTDVALFHGVLHILLQKDWIDRSFTAEHTRSFAGLKELMRDHTLAAVTDICDVDRADLRRCTEWIGRSPHFLSLWCMGLNQSSTDNAKGGVLIDLHLAAGKIGHAGCGSFSLTGQPNAMGGRKTGSSANLLPGHREAADPSHRAEVAHCWGVEQSPTSPGLSAIELSDAVHDDRIKALWIACANPARSLPDQRRIHEALARYPFVVVQGAFADTEACQYADLLFPAASWREKEGSMTNSERRVSHVHRAVPPSGGARQDQNVVCDFTRRLEKHLRPAKPDLFASADGCSLFNEYKLLIVGRDLDLSGLSYALLDRLGP